MKAITTDNRLEFSKHGEIAKALNCKIYFCVIVAHKKER